MGKIVRRTPISSVKPLPYFFSIICKFVAGTSKKRGYNCGKFFQGSIFAKCIENQGHSCATLSLRQATSQSVLSANASLLFYLADCPRRRDRSPRPLSAVPRPRPRPRGWGGPGPGTGWGWPRGAQTGWWRGRPWWGSARPRRWPRVRGRRAGRGPGIRDLKNKHQVSLLEYLTDDAVA